MKSGVQVGEFQRWKSEVCGSTEFATWRWSQGNSQQWWPRGRDLEDVGRWDEKQEKLEKVGRECLTLEVFGDSWIEPRMTF